jgi:mannosyl-oligosaccharide glucosidase
MTQHKSRSCTAHVSILLGHVLRVSPSMNLLWLLVPLSSGVFCQPANDTLWGPYRPNLYFGLRPRIPQSLMTGLIWFGTQNYQSIGQVRHSCEQGDGLDTYTWSVFDSRDGGVQTLKDSHNNIKITTEFLKVAGGIHGGSWAARIKGDPINPGERQCVIMFP